MENRLSQLKTEIEKVFERFCGSKVIYDADEIYIEDELTKVFNNFKDIVSVLSIEELTTFESPGYDCGVISVAFVNPVTGLETYLEQWERT